MKQRKIDRILLGVSVGGFFLMSLSFLVMPVASLAVIPGLMFWLGLTIGVTLQILLEVRRRRFFEAYSIKREKMQKPRNGLLSFGSNKMAMIADLATVVSVLAMILAFVFTKGYGYICYVFITAAVFSFCMHCILNGRIYFHAKNQLKIRQALEQKKVKLSGKGESRR